jgi:cobalt-zinc-cadmium efflux system membrane fusion protein
MNARSAYWIRTVLALAIAAGLGYFAARVTASDAPPVTAGSEQPKRAPSDTLRVKPEDLAAMRILTEAAMPGTLDSDVIAPATVDAEIRGQAVLTAHVAGAVVRITKRIGDPVREGETIAVVEGREAAAMAAERDIAQSKLALAHSALAREKELFEKLVTPRQDLERAQAELEAAEAEARRANAAIDAAHVMQDGKAVAVISPLSGTIIARTASLGLFVQPETELFRVADPHFIDIDAAVTPADAQRIAVGDRAKVVTQSGLIVTAAVRSVTPTVNEQTRSATVVLDPLPDQPVLAPGEVVRAEITLKKDAQTGIVVPEEAVQNIDARDVVFVRSPEGFKVQPVVVGTRVQGMASITSGLEVGQVVATQNAFLLKAELSKGAGEEE